MAEPIKHKNDIALEYTIISILIFREKTDVKSEKAQTLLDFELTKPSTGQDYA